MAGNARNALSGFRAAAAHDPRLRFRLQINRPRISLACAKSLTCQRGSGVESRESMRRPATRETLCPAFLPLPRTIHACASGFKSTGPESRLAPQVCLASIKTTNHTNHTKTIRAIGVIRGCLPLIFSHLPSAAFAHLPVAHLPVMPPILERQHAPPMILSR